MKTEKNYKGTSTMLLKQKGKKEKKDLSPKWLLKLLTVSLTTMPSYAEISPHGLTAAVVAAVCGQHSCGGTFS